MKVSVENVEAAQKQQKAVELRLQGKTFDEIAQEVGYATRAGAYQSVVAALKRSVREPSKVVRRRELERLEYLLKKWWGRAVGQNPDGSPIPTGPNGPALEYVLKILDQIHKIEGVYAPKKVRIGGDDEAPPIKMEATIDWNKLSADDMEKLSDIRNRLFGIPSGN